MNIVQTTTIFGVGIALASATSVIVGAAIYDMLAAKRQRRLLKHPFARQLRRRPLISVVVVDSGSDTDRLKQCLLGIAKNGYRKYEILLTTRTNTTSVMRVAKQVQGELVVVLYEPAVLAPGALKNAVQRFAIDTKLQALTFKQQSFPNTSLPSLAQRFAELAGGQLKKSLDVVGDHRHYASDTVIYGRNHSASAIVFRAGAAKAIAPASTKAASATLAGLKRFWLAGGLLLGGYGVYLALTRSTAYLLAIIWLSLSVFLWLAVWSDEHLKLWQKAKLSLLAPVMLGPLYLVALLRLVAIPRKS